MGEMTQDKAVAIAKQMLLSNIDLFASAMGGVIMEVFQTDSIEQVQLPPKPRKQRVDVNSTAFRTAMATVIIDGEGRLTKQQVADKLGVSRETLSRNAKARAIWATANAMVMSEVHTEHDLDYGDI